MQKFLLCILLFVSITLNAQNDQTPKQDTADPFTIITSMSDSLLKLREDSIFKESLEQQSHNLDSFLQMRKEQDARQKRNAMIRIGIGILFLIVLVIGLRRRGKK